MDRALAPRNGAGPHAVSRVNKKGTWVTFAYDGNGNMIEGDATNRDLHFLHRDRLGSIAMMTDVNGQRRAARLRRIRLTARCRRRLWDVARNHDPERAAHIDAKPGRATAIWPSRRPGYLREKPAELRALAEQAGHGAVRWA